MKQLPYEHPIAFDIRLGLAEDMRRVEMAKRRILSELDGADYCRQRADAIERGVTPIDCQTTTHSDRHWWNCYG